MKNGATKFKLEKGVSIPSPWLTAKYDWPFGEMKVGESFLFPVLGDGILAPYNSRQTILSHAREWRSTGRRFTTRLMPDRKNIRVWRVA